MYAVNILSINLYELYNERTMGMKVGIIGAGTMGSGIAQAFAQTEGYEVMLCDINETFAANGKNKIAKGFEKRIAKGKMTKEDADKILGLNVGADDYVTKPFNPLELVARVKSQLRRYTRLGAAIPVENAHIYETGGLSINDDLKEVRVDGDVVKLTPIEYNILLLLMKNQGRVFSINQIYENIWNEEAVAADNTVAVHIRHIREKIEINPREPRYLKVVWGLGYKIEKI